MHGSTGSKYSNLVIFIKITIKDYQFPDNKLNLTEQFVMN